MEKRQPGQGEGAKGTLARAPESLTVTTANSASIWAEVEQSFAEANGRIIERDMSDLERAIESMQDSIIIHDENGELTRSAYFALSFGRPALRELRVAILKALCINAARVEA
jgi:hypothetical protein